MRGAFTAGALAWLVDQGIEFDASYGISTGAVHLTNYLMKRREDLFDFSVHGITDKRFIGLSAMLRCGRIVDYDYLFDHIMTVEKKFDISSLKDCREGFIGVYDLGAGKTHYLPTREISLKQLEASTSLPILGIIVNCDGRELMDGGITDMIPIAQAKADGCNRHLIITTKPYDYVRKPAKPFVVWLMKKMYPQCENISKDYERRHLNYEQQIGMIREMVDKKEAVYVYPTKHSNVTRLGGTTEELQELYDLGYSEMENKKEEILALLKKE